MGASDPAERDLYQGLIKLAAALVHDVRGNPAGVRKNLIGARDLLIDAGAAGSTAQIDVPALVAGIDGRLSPGGGSPPGSDPIPIPMVGSVEPPEAVPNADQVRGDNAGSG
jgi:hypothetical protein